MMLRRYMSLALGRAQPINHSQRRYTRLAQAMFTAVAGKGVGLVVSFIAVPLTVGYLGAERYGVWITISSLLAWLQIADLGLGNGLTNAISEAYATEQPDLAQSYVATTVWILSGIVLVLCAALSVVWWMVDWAAAFNVQSTLAKSEIGPAIAALFTITLLSLPFSIVEKVYGAYQENTIANYWQATGNVASLLSILLVTRLNGGLVWLVVAFSGALLLVKIASAVLLFGLHKQWLRPTYSSILWSSGKKLVSTGGMFFVVQIAVLINIYTGNLIIAHFLGAEQVTPYSVTWRLFSYTTLLQALIFPALWPAYAEAFTRKDGRWIKCTFKANIISSVLLTGALASIFVVFGNTIIQRWAGAAAVPPFSLLVWMALWSVINTAMNATACILNGAGRVKGQMIYGLTTAIVNVMLAFALVLPLGITGVIASTVIAYVLCNVVPAAFETSLVFKKLADA